MRQSTRRLDPESPCIRVAFRLPRIRRRSGAETASQFAPPRLMSRRSAVTLSVPLLPAIRGA